MIKRLNCTGKRYYIFMVLTIAVARFYVALMCNKTMPFAEGWYTYYAQLINEKGLLPYRDFEYLFSPLYIYFIAFVTRFFGYDIYRLILDSRCQSNAAQRKSRRKSKSFSLWPFQFTLHKCKTKCWIDFLGIYNSSNYLLRRVFSTVHKSNCKKFNAIFIAYCSSNRCNLFVAGRNWNLFQNAMPEASVVLLVVVALMVALAIAEHKNKVARHDANGAWSKIADIHGGGTCWQ